MYRGFVWKCVSIKALLNTQSVQDIVPFYSLLSTTKIPYTPTASQILSKSSINVSLNTVKREVFIPLPTSVHGFEFLREFPECDQKWRAQIPEALVRNGLGDKWDSNSPELSIRLETDNVSARLTRRRIPATAGRETIQLQPRGFSGFRQNLILCRSRSSLKILIISSKKYVFYVSW